MSLVQKRATKAARCQLFANGHEIVIVPICWCVESVCAPVHPLPGGSIQFEEIAMNVSSLQHQRGLLSTRQRSHGWRIRCGWPRYRCSRYIFAAMIAVELCCVTSWKMFCYHLCRCLQVIVRAGRIVVVVQRGGGGGGRHAEG